MTLPSIRLLIPYFGSWEPWTPLFFETARRNPSIDFLIVTDCDPTGLGGANLEFRHMPFDEYQARIRAILGDLSPGDPYKVCDYRPLFGRLHRTDFEGWDFWGWCDTDILLGDVRSFYDADLLSRVDVLSTHSDRISGHFALFRNDERNRRMYERIYDWQGALRNPCFVGIDEHGLGNALTMTVFDRINEKLRIRLDTPVSRWASRRRTRRLYMREQYTTPFLPRPWLDGSLNSAQPSRWYWKDGNVTNARDGDRRFIYLHLMNFKSSRWRHDGTKAPWEGRSNFCQATVADMESGLVIDEVGIRTLGKQN